MTTTTFTIACCALALVGCDGGAGPLDAPGIDEHVAVEIDEPVDAFAFVESDLVIATATSLRRVSLDGSERWRVPSDGLVRMLVARPGVILAGGNRQPELVAYRDDDGSVAWSRNTQYLADVVLGADGDAVVSTLYGQIIALDPSSGTEHWGASGPYSKQAADLVRDRDGNLAGKYYSGDTELYRYDPSGAVLASWRMPTPLGQMAFEATGELLGGSYPTFEQSTPVAYTRFDRTGRATTFVSEAGPALRFGFAPRTDGIFQWHRFTDPGPVTVSSLDRAGTLRWSFEIAKDSTRVFGPVCADDARCAVAESASIHVFTVP